jgi:hypothetical protein
MPDPVIPDADKPVSGSRITTDQRNRIIDRLSASYAHDCIDQEEFERRVTEAHEVVTHRELLLLVADLPEFGPETPAYSSRHASGPAHGSASGSVPGIKIASGPVPENENFIAILGGTERKGPWRPARHSRVRAVLGGVELDYRDASFPPGVSEITVFCVLGGLEITVPPGVNVEMSGIPILGGFENKAGSGNPGAPTLRVKGTVILGGIEARVKKKKNRRGLFRKEP